MRSGRHLFLGSGLRPTIEQELMRWRTRYRYWEESAMRERLLQAGAEGLAMMHFGFEVGMWLLRSQSHGFAAF